MYIYFGWMHYDPYAIYKAFYLVAETELKFGTQLTRSMIQIIPPQPARTPVAIIGTLFAGVGLYDALNDADVEVQRLLFHNEDMSRKTSGGIPINDDNDLTIMHVQIKNKMLTFRVATMTRVGENPIFLSSIIDQENLFTKIMEISWTKLENQVIQACKFVKISNLVPIDNAAQKLSDLSEESSYRDVILFQFTNTINTILIHAYVANCTRNYDVITIPKSKLMVLKMTKCRIDIDDKYRTSFSTGGLSENKTYEMIMKNGGYYAYSWRVGWPIFAYMLQDLSNEGDTKVLM
ncbi:15733_t:CDS:2 [Funneliformis geosporum]|uniref:15733_t:CDS:1 n=1 Tax=Funneliformis geosporum TaxID=1117311 RepID=A0A9W4SHF5_9GLOM|nr:15733_t:CDS:2 [Funneliformis geosporum]